MADKKYITKKDFNQVIKKKESKISDISKENKDNKNNITKISKSIKDNNLRNNKK